MLKLVIQIVDILCIIFLVAVVLLQSGKQAGLSGSIAGGAETFFGKNKGRTMDAMLKKFTAVAAVLFVALTLSLSLIR